MGVMGHEGGDGPQLERIAVWHAGGMDVLDEMGVPRMADGLEYTIAERIERLRGAVSALEDAAEHLRLATLWIVDTERHYKLRQAEQRARNALGGR